MFGSVRSVERVAGSCKRRRNLQKICRNLQKPSRSAPKIAEISLDLLESRRISPNMVEISLGSPRMSPDLTKSRLNVAGSHQISIGSPRILLDLYITSIRLGGSSFGEENPPLDPPALGLGCGNPSPTVEVVGSGSCRFGFRRVAWVAGWVGHP